MEASSPSTMTSIKDNPLGDDDDTIDTDTDVSRRFEWCDGVSDVVA